MYKFAYIEKLMVKDIVTPAAGVTCSLNLGAFSSTGTGDGKGVKLTSANTAALRVYTDDGGVAPGAYNFRAGIFRYLNTTNTTTDTSTYGIQGQLKAYRASGSNTLWSNGDHAGVWAYTEIATSAATAATLGSTTAALRATIDVDKAFTVAASSVVAGIVVDGTFAGSVTATGTHAAIHIGNRGDVAWTHALSFSSATLCGATTQATAFAGLTSSHKIAVNIAGTTVYIPCVTAWS